MQQNPNKHICIIIAILVTGGSDNQLFSICTRLQKLGYNITIYAQLPQTKYGSKKNKLREIGIHVRQPPRWITPVAFTLGVLRYFPQLTATFFRLPTEKRWTLHSYRDIYHCIDEEFSRNIFNFLLIFRIRVNNIRDKYRLVCGYHASTYKVLHKLKHLLKIPVFYTEISSPKYRAEQNIHPEGVGEYINSFDMVFVPSKVIGEELELYEGLRNHFDVIPFFINLPAYDYRPPDRPARTFGIMARLSREKNHAMLINACAKVIETIPDARLILVGNGPQEEEYKHLTRELGLAESVVFRKPYKKIDDVIHLIDIITLCSDVEGMPLSLLEALYFGKPIIATPVGSVPDMVIPCYNGYIVGKGAEDELADALISIMGDLSKYQTMSMHSRQHYFIHFEPEEQFNKMLTHIDNACK